MPSVITRARLHNISCLLFGLTAGIAVLGMTHSSNVIAGGAGGSVSALTAVAPADTAGERSSSRIDIVAPTDPSPPPCNDQLITVLGDNFDNVMPPALPGWTASNGIDPDGILWQSSSTGLPSPPADSLPNAAWVNDPPLPSDKYLDSPPFYVFEAWWAQLTFRHNFNLEASDVDPDLGFDGAVLEISSFYINNGEFTDITDPAVGGSFITGGYNRTISSDRRARRRDKGFRNVVATRLRSVHPGAWIHKKYNGPQGRGYSSSGFYLTCSRVGNDFGLTR